MRYTNRQIDKQMRWKKLKINILIDKNSINLHRKNISVLSLLMATKEY